jgi:hypothetical protein
MCRYINPDMGHVVEVKMPCRLAVLFIVVQWSRDFFRLVVTPKSS